MVKSRTIQLQNRGFQPDGESMTLSEAAQWISTKTGTPEPHLSTLHRWAREGVRGVRLRTTRVGAKFWTTPEALAEFLDALNSKSEERAPKAFVGEETSFSQAVRRKQIDAACTDIDHLCRGFQ